MATDDSSFADRIAGFRQKLERKRKSVQGKRRAKTRSKKRGPKAREKAAKERRIEQRNPDNLREGAASAAKEGKKTLSEAKELLATELGVEQGEVEGLAEELNEIKNDFGDALDIDGDGDTDLLQVVDQPMKDDENPLMGAEAVDPVDGGGDEFDPTQPVAGDDAESFVGDAEDDLFG